MRILAGSLRGRQFQMAFDYNEKTSMPCERESSFAYHFETG